MRDAQIEAALTLLADQHNRYLWRERSKGWGFAQGNSRASQIYPTIREAVEAEVARLRSEAEGAKRASDAQKTRIRAFTEQADALEAAL